MEGAPLTSLETYSGISFPSNTVVLRQSDERALARGYLRAVFFSTAPITIPCVDGFAVTREEPSVWRKAAEFLKKSGSARKSQSPSGAALEFLESEIKRPVKGFKSDYGCEWVTNGYEFRGKLITTTHGRYLILERFDLKRGSMTSSRRRLENPMHFEQFTNQASFDAEVTFVNILQLTNFGSGFLIVTNSAGVTIPVTNAAWVNYWPVNASTSTFLSTWNLDQKFLKRIELLQTGAVYRFQDYFVK